MKVTIGVQTEAQVIARAVAAVHSHREAETAYITFLSSEQLFKTLTPIRWQIIQEMTGAGPMSIRELARRLDRDVNRVDEDVDALLNTGVLDREESGEIVFPYDKVHVNFTLTAADRLQE
ncbi:transcriptional regulator [Paraburkholderia sp. SIMBA_053]|uniref:HVO_A0114 family putative DNA-binding protein n=1 Tax=Paraburkholderia sp. SIMBA_053 TaxID=3085794 RepID=UPI00397B07B8